MPGSHTNRHGGAIKSLLAVVPFSVLEVTIVLGKNCERTVSIVFGLDKETNNIQLELGYTTKGYVGTASKAIACRARIAK